MRNADKKQLITESLQHLKDKDLFKISKFDKDVSIWSNHTPRSMQHYDD